MTANFLTSSGTPPQCRPTRPRGHRQRYRGQCVAEVGTTALHAGLKLAGVRRGDLVVTQPLTFVATCNAIAYCAADPAFVDVEGAFANAPTTITLYKGWNQFANPFAWPGYWGDAQIEKDDNTYSWPHRGDLWQHV